MNHVLRKNKKFVIILMCLLLGYVQWTFAQSNQVRGKVTDETGEAIIGASVVQKDANVGTATDQNGNFTLDVPGNATLVISYIGYLPKEVKVNNQTDLIIQLSEDMQLLEEVVVTGYTSQRKSTLTGSISSVSNKELVVTKNENVINMLTGKMPGLRISQKSARPGDYNTVIDVRGFGEPLFVIDGVPRDRDYFARMDPEEIETVSLLKDAAAAVYGMRAANGVMLITTKSGTAQQGKVDITYTGNFSIQQMVNVPYTLTPTEWMTLRNEQWWQDFGQNYYNRRTARHTDEEFSKWASNSGYDWMSEIFRKNSPETQHNLSINGGSESLRYFVSLGYSKQDGAFASGSLWADRWNLRSNVDAKITNRLSAKISIGAILNQTHRPGTDLWSVYKTAWLQRPDAPFYANNEPGYLNGDDEFISDANNLIAATNSDVSGYSLNKERRLSGALNLTYEIPGIKGLSATAMYDYGIQISDVNNYRKSFYLYKYNGTADTYDPVLRNAPSRITRSANFNTDTDMQLGFAYNNKFENHSFNARLVFEELYQTRDDNFMAQRDLLKNSEYLFAGEDNGQVGSGGTPYDRLNQAFIGQFNYDYAGKYLADFRFRYDGSSRYPKGARWGFFPSISLGWRISEESFIKTNIDFLSNLKLRASYGEVGDDAAASNYPPIYVGYAIDSGTRAWLFDGSSLEGGVKPLSIPNPNLTWYKVVMKNIALDFGVFQNKLTGTFELFQRDRSGLLATSNAVIPGTVGASLPQENLNSDRNFGWEIELAYRNRLNKDIDYFVSGQFSATRSMRTKWLEEPASNSYDEWRNRTSGRYNDIWWSRKAGGMFTSLDQIRNFQLYPMGQGSLPGDWWFEDWNGDGIIDGGDDHPYATRGLPLMNFGLSLGGSYKDFDLTMNFQGAYKIYLALSELYTEALPFGGQNTLYWFMDRWYPVNPNADYFSSSTEWVSGYYPVTGHDSRRSGSNYIMDASYIRLKTLELGYSIPKQLLSKLGIKGLRLYVSGYNLLTFCKLRDIDPERPGAERGVGSVSSDPNSDPTYVDMYGYPNNRTLTVGASIKF